MQQGGGRGGRDGGGAGGGGGGGGWNRDAWEEPGWIPHAGSGGGSSSRAGRVDDPPRDLGRSSGHPPRSFGDRGEEFVSQNILSGNYKGALLDICSKMRINPATFDIVQHPGPLNRPHFQCTIKVYNPVTRQPCTYIGDGPNKKASEQAAAEKAFHEMKSLGAYDGRSLPNNMRREKNRVGPKRTELETSRGGNVVNSWESLADDNGKPWRNDPYGRNVRSRGKNSTSATGSESLPRPRDTSERGAAAGGDQFQTHGINLDISAESLDISLDDAKGHLQASVGKHSGGLEFQVESQGSAHAPVFLASVTIPGVGGGMIGDLVGYGKASNKKTAEKYAALDACVKLAQLGMLKIVGKGSKTQKAAAARQEARKSIHAGDVGAVPLVSSKADLENLLKAAEDLRDVPHASIEHRHHGSGEEDSEPTRAYEPSEIAYWNRQHALLAQERELNPRYRRILEGRQLLPGYKMREACVSTILQNRVTIVSGDTGCGKTTQVPQAVFDHYVSIGLGGTCHCVVTQPRRVSAMSVAERVAAERVEILGTTVGYQIRQESVLPRSCGSLLFCTTGVLIRRLTKFIRTGAQEIPNISIIFVDEVHERDVNSDFLLIMLKRLMVHNPSLRIVLMSATINADKFSRFFDSCPIVTIPGRTFDVNEQFLEDYVTIIARPFPSASFGNKLMRSDSWRREKLERNRTRARSTQEYSEAMRQLRHKGLDEDELAAVASMSDVNFIDYDMLTELILHIDQDPRRGSILCFLPGWEEILSAHEMLLSHPYVVRNPRFVVLRLHSNISPQEQQEVFRPVAEEKRKVVLSTNIAETSVTLDDCVFVIDSGRAKRMTYDPHTQISSLGVAWASKANVKQRKGRAGRVCEGVCYRLFTRSQFVGMQEEMDPDMTVVPLDQICLSTLALQIGNCQEIEVALKSLRELGATDEQQQLLPLGHKLCQMHMEPRLAKMLVVSTVFRCLRPMLAVVCGREFKDPFVSDPRTDEARLRVAGRCCSDQLLMAEILNLFESACDRSSAEAYDLCNRNLLNYNLLNQMKSFQNKVLDMVSKAMTPYHAKRGRTPLQPFLMDSSTWDRHVELVRAVICSGLLPNVARVYVRSSKKKMILRDGTRVSAQMKSVVQLDNIDTCDGFVCFHELIRTTQLFASDLCLARPLAVAIFCGKVERCEDGLLCDNWIRLAADKELVNAVLLVREAAKRSIDRHVLGVGLGSKSAEVDLQAVLRALTGQAGGETHYHVEETSILSLPRADVAPAYLDDMYYGRAGGLGMGRAPVSDWRYGMVPPLPGGVNGSAHGAMDPRLQRNSQLPGQDSWEQQGGARPVSDSSNKYIPPGRRQHMLIH